MSTRRNERLEVRRGLYKAAADGDAARRRREVSLAKIRNDKEETLLRKRKQKTEVPETSETSTLTSPFNSAPHVLEALYSEDVKLQIQATKSFRNALMIEDMRTFEGVISAGILPRFVRLLEREDYPELQIEAAAILANIVSGSSEHTKAVVNCGALPIFAGLLHSSNDDLREKVIWALGNVIADSPSLRDKVLSHGTLNHFLKILSGNANVLLKRTTTWALSHICKAYLRPRMKKAIIFALQGLIRTDDEEVVTDACYALSYLTYGDQVEIQDVVKAGVCPRLVELLAVGSDSLRVPAIRTLSNIISCSDSLMQRVLACHVIPSLVTALTSTRFKSIQKEACWAMAHITSGSKEQIQAVIDADVIPFLVHLLQTEDFNIKREAAWVIAGIASGGTPEQIKFLVHRGCIRPICNLLEYPDVDTIVVCLQFLENVLLVAGKEGVGMVKDCRVLDKLENLLGHDKAEIYEKAFDILDKYWPDDVRCMPSSGLRGWGQKSMLKLTL